MAKTAWKIILAVLMVLLVLLIVAEMGTRWFLAQRIVEPIEAEAEAAGIELQEQPSVRFGNAPVVLGLVRGSLPELYLDTPSTLHQVGDVIYGQPAAAVHARGLSLGEPAVADVLTVSTTLPDYYLLATIQQALTSQDALGSWGSVVVTDLTSTPGQLDVEFANGLASIRLIPTTSLTGQLAFQPVDSTLFGLNLGDSVTSALAGALNGGLAEALGNDMRVEEFEAVAGGLFIRTTGTNIVMSQELVQPQQQPALRP